MDDGLRCPSGYDGEIGSTAARGGGVGSATYHPTMRTPTGRRASDATGWRDDGR
jgi:hypothetical protein